MATVIKHVGTILREATRHLLRRPVVGVVALAQTPDARVLLIRRADSGAWALPGGTLEWGETVRDAVVREVWEEAGARVSSVGDVAGVYSRPDRDPRFHAVTVVVRVAVDEPTSKPQNPLEVREACLFAVADLPAEFSHGMADMLRDALAGSRGHIE